MPAPTVTITRAQGQPQSSPGIDFAMCIIGCSSATPLSAGALSSAYYSPSAIVADYGIGDGVDAVCHALTKTTDNPAPPGVSFLSTHGMSGLTAGVRGATLDVSHVTGGTTVSKTASTHPEGTYQPYVKVLDDGNSGAGTAIGTAGIILQASLDGGRTFLPSVALGTATTFKIQVPNPGGSAIDTGVQYDFTHASGSDKLATGDYWTESKTTPPQWAGSDLYTAGTVPTGALSTIAQSAQSFGLIAITEPVAAADIEDGHALLRAGRGGLRVEHARQVLELAACRLHRLLAQALDQDDDQERDDDDRRRRHQPDRPPLLLGHVFHWAAFIGRSVGPCPSSA